MKKVSLALVTALTLGLLVPASADAWSFFHKKPSQQQGQADQGQAGQSGQSGQNDQGTPVPEPTPTDPTTPPDQDGDEGQTPGQNPGQNPGQTPDQTPGQGGKFCGKLWESIKKLFTKDPAQQAEQLKKLLVLTVKDLELCLNTIDGKEKKYKNVVPAVGHLNHALSALDKAHPPKHLKPAFKELSKRISHAKFYLVVADFEEVQARVQSAIDYIGELN